MWLPCGGQDYLLANKGYAQHEREKDFSCISFSVHFKKLEQTRDTTQIKVEVVKFRVTHISYFKFFYHNQKGFQMITVSLRTIHFLLFTDYHAFHITINSLRKPEQTV